MLECTPALFKTFEALTEVPEEQLQWLIDQSDCNEYADGDVLFEPGNPMIGTFFVISGKVRLYLPIGGVKRDIGDIKPGEISGYLPYSRAKVGTGYSVAIGPTQIMIFPKDQIDIMIRSQFELTQALVHVMTNRVRTFTTLQQQNEKMLALGKLSAGLTHELNNPASAIVRDSESLLKHLQMEPISFKSMIAIRMEPEQVDAVTDEFFRFLTERKDVNLTIRERADKEEELTDLFDEMEMFYDPELPEN